MPNVKPENLLQYIILALYIALIVFLPTIHGIMPSYMYLHDRHRLLQLALLAAVLIYSVITTHNITPIDNKVRIGLYSLLCLTIVSCLGVQNFRHAVIEISIFAALCYLALFFAKLYHDNKILFTKQLQLWLWVSITLYIFAFLVGYLTACIFKTPIKWPQPLLGFNNPRLFNQYQLWGLGLAYLPLLSGQHKNKNLILNVALALWWAILFYTASRGVIAACLAGLTVTALVYRKLAYPLLRAQALHVLIGLGTYYFLFKIAPQLINIKLETGEIMRSTNSGRSTLWSIAISLTREHPFFGVGPMQYPWYGPSNHHPHNSILQLTSEWGLPATFIMLSLAGFGVYNWLKRFGLLQVNMLSKSESNLAILLFLTLVTNAAYSLADGVIVMPMSQVMMFTVIGIMIGQCTCTMELKATNRKFRLRPIFASIVLVALAWSNFPEVKQGLVNYQAGVWLSGEKINPRIWIQMAPPPKTSQ